MSSRTSIRSSDDLLKPSWHDLHEVVRLKHQDGDPANYGWGTRMRMNFKYFTPDEVYEYVVGRLVTPGASWLDVGCGRHVFPGNPGLARQLADRCGRLVGVDPDQTIEENPFVHERVRSRLDVYRSEAEFDVVTLRMVAEHITDPPAAVESMARLTRVGGCVAVFTVNLRAPTSIVSRIVPFRLHHPIKQWLWNTDEKDTFPVAYRMNTRSRLRRLFEDRGFREVGFAYLDDCRSFAAKRTLLFMELTACTVLRKIGLWYPENCLLGIYERREDLARR